MLEKFLSSVFDQEHEFQDLWELKLIKFDINLDEERKSYEKHLAVSSMVEDMKGNPGQKGNFYITNLRLIWHANNDKELNLSIGLDTITYATLKSYPQQGFQDLKHVLIIKAMSPSQTKYQFKFAGFKEAEERLFRKVENMFKKFSDSKLFRNIDTNPKLVNKEYRPFPGEEIKTTYQNCMFAENERIKEATIFLTDIRLVIVHQKPGHTNYGIPWIMIEKFLITDFNSKEAVKLQIRGLLKDVELFVMCANRIEFSKMHKQMVSFSETYNKNPTLGMDFSSLEEKVDPATESFKTTTEISQFEQTKVNIGRKKNIYGDQNQRGSLKDTFFNEQLGIMMQKLPEGCSRNDLWEILRI